MKFNLRIVSILICMLMVVVLACTEQDEIALSQSDAVGRSAQVVHLGLVGGVDAVDSDGNVWVARNVTLTSGNTYILHNRFWMTSGYTLTIEPGVTIKGVSMGIDPNHDRAPGTVIISQGARIDAVGDRVAPRDSAIVFTSNKSAPLPGDWGGVVLLGRGPLSVLGGVATLEAISGSYFGGSVSNDNSGELQFVRIEYAGHVISTGNELSGLTLGAVGSGTVIDHVQVSHCLEDGFEFLGGTVSAKYLIAYENDDEDYYVDMGHRGKLQFGISLRDPNGGNVPQGGSSGIEAWGNNNIGVTPYTQTTFANFTILGPITPYPGTGANPLFRSAIRIAGGAEIDVFNSIVAGYPIYQLEMQRPEDFDLDGVNTTDDVVSIEAVTFVYPTFSGLNSMGTNVSMSLPAYDNRVIAASILGTTTGLNTLIRATSLPANAWTKGSRDLVPFLEQPSVTSHALLSGLIAVDFRGAFGSATDTNNANWYISGAWVAIN